MGCGALAGCLGPGVGAAVGLGCLGSPGGAAVGVGCRSSPVCSDTARWKISASWVRASIVVALMGANGAAGVGFFNALINSMAAFTAKSLDDSVGSVHYRGINSTVSPILSAAVLST